MVSLEGLLWYIFPVECLVGLFRVELFFPAKKAQDDRREVHRPAGILGFFRGKPIFQIFVLSLQTETLYAQNKGLTICNTGQTV